MKKTIKNGSCEIEIDGNFKDPEHPKIKMTIKKGCKGMNLGEMK